MLITLTPLDLSEVWRISHLRVDYCRQVKAGYTPYLVGDRLSFEVNSFGAEVAFCRLVGAAPDLDPTHFMSYDAIVRGKRIDVKWTSRMDGRLQAKALKEWQSPPDYFCLMIGRLPVYFLAGYMRADELLRPERLDNRRQRTPVYTAGQDELYAEMY